MDDIIHASDATQSPDLEQTQTPFIQEKKHFLNMKLIIVGSSGYVGKALVRQAVSSPAITSVVGLGRRETPVPENLDNPADAAKLTSVVCDDFLNYSDDVKEKLSGADACIW